MHALQCIIIIFATFLCRGISTMTKKTMGFISINEELSPEEREVKQQKWMLLRQQHLNKLGMSSSLLIPVNHALF